MESELITVPQAAKLLSLSRATLYRLMAERKLPYVAIGTSRRLRRADVMAFIEANTVRPNK